MPRLPSQNVRAMDRAIADDVMLRHQVCRDDMCIADGTVHPGCAGHSGSRTERRPCMRKPMNGMNRCYRHGGHVKLMRAQAEARMLALDLSYGDPIQISPTAALLGELYRTQGHVNWLSQKIREMQPDDLVWGTVSELVRPIKGEKGAEDPDELVTETRKAAQLNEWMKLYHIERKMLVTVTKTCIDAGIAERQMQVIEAQAVVLAQVIQVVLTDARLGVAVPPATQAAVVRDAMSRMELISG